MSRDSARSCATAQPLRDRSDRQPDASEDLARRIAMDLGMHDWLWVEEAVRRRHRVLFADYDRISSIEYDFLRDAVQADLISPYR